VSQRYEVRKLRKDGETIWCEMMATRIEYRGRPAIMGNIIDITERKRAEAERESLKQQLKHLSHQMIENIEEERRRISFELHDVIGQALGVVTIKLSMIQQELRNQVLVERETGQALEITREAMQELRRLSEELCPFILDRTGLVPTLEWYVRQFGKRSGMKITLTKIDLPKLPRELEINLFRVVQEALSNSLRHGHAPEAMVDIEKKHNVLFLTIKDKGIGFDINELDKKEPWEMGIGIASMRERINSMGGYFFISSQKGKGTTVKADVLLG
jgi:two-component system NarL family sensor kinase